MLTVAMFFLAPYFYTMGSAVTSTIFNTTNYLNQTAYEILEKDWPVYQDQFSSAWQRFQDDPQNWIIAYPVALLIGAALIYTFAPTVTPHQDEDYTDNILVRRKRNSVVYTITDRGARKHTMVLRSMGPALLYEIQ